MALDNDYFRHGRQEMLPFIPARRGRVLEIGCGEGGFSGSLPGVDEVWGIEPSASATVATKRLTRVFQATFDDASAELPLAYFDLVICNDVIEHMARPHDFLSRIAQYIAPGGMLVGSIPNVRYYENMFQYLFEKDWHYRDSGILDRTHLAFFTEKSLYKTLIRHRFKVLRLQGINGERGADITRRGWVYRIAAYVLIVATFGYFSDIRYLQFAFQVTPNAE